MELQQRLTAALGLPLPTTVAFDHPTIARLSQHLLAELGWTEPVPATETTDVNGREAAPDLLAIPDSDLDSEITKRLDRLEALVRGS